MKKLLITLVVLGSAAVLAWQSRVELLVWGLPKFKQVFDPIPENRPITWAKGPDEATSRVEDRKPNIVLILFDDMGFNDVSLYNGGAADGSLMTPNIDDIGRQGVTFTNGYAANAVCAPSRASIMTGRYSTRFGFEFTPIFKAGPTIFQWMQDIEKPVLPTFVDLESAATLPGLESLGMPAEEITIAELLQEVGYYTAHVGKWHLGGTGDKRPEAQGFDDSLYMSGTLYLPEDHPDVVNAKREEEGIERMVWATGQYSAQFNGSERFKPDGYLTDYYTNEALQIIENNQHRPFFLFLSHWGIHNPLQATREDYDSLSHIEDHHLRVYAAMIKSVDRSVARVTEKLEQLGLTENTLILLTSDNGGASYIHLPDVNKPYRGWKVTHFEGGTHVPFMVKWPARIQPGTQVDSSVHHIDLFSTIAAAAGADLPGDRKIDGVDLMPYITGEQTGAPHQTLFWRQGHHQSVQHEGWKLIRTENPKMRWLFNLAEDPTEARNLAASFPGKVAELEALLARHNAEQVKPLWPSVINMPLLVDKHGGQEYVEGDEYIYWPN